MNLLGNQANQQQWENGNAFVAFPLADNYLPEGFPTEAIVDACIVVPSYVKASLADVTLQCLHISRFMISVVFAAGSTPVLACNVPASTYQPYLPRKLEALDPLYSGMVTFGDIALENYDTPLTIRQPIKLSESAVVRPIIGRLRRFVRIDTGQVASGDVGIILPDEVSMKVSEYKDESLVQFSAKNPDKSIVDRPCDGVESPLTPIRSINGVYPDGYGRVAIVFGEAQ